jgi:GTP-binding protein EngB required for normal cell division
VQTPHHPSSIMAPQVPGASLQIVGEQVNLLVDAIEQLRKLGLKEIDTELPELVLIGDQSAGKSSLMGAIAEINLPKQMGMCTRCPANIKTAPSDTWSCTVSLHEYYNFSNDARRAPTKSNLFPPWRENEDQGLTIRHFKTVSDKSELEEVLRWAQIALLNPSQDYHAFIPGIGTVAQNGLNMGHKHEADFSPNIVAIEISGPRLPALSFYDLPGIFLSAASKEEQYLIKVFENLVTKYIKRENALIILAMAMESDPGLSRTSAIIKEQRAENRTIGVLTKADRLQRGSKHEDYDAILKGTKHLYPRGYFATKQPGPDFVPRGDYHAEAREEETAFFNSDPLWCGAWQAYRDRCGTAAIQSYLSQEFARLIAQR